MVKQAVPHREETDASVFASLKTTVGSLARLGCTINPVSVSPGSIEMDGGGSGVVAGTGAFAFGPEAAPAAVPMMAVGGFLEVDEKSSKLEGLWWMIALAVVGVLVAVVLVVVVYRVLSKAIGTSSFTV